MRYIKLVVAATALLVSAGCASLDCNPNTGKALPGTDTAVVGLYIDKNGYPQSTIDTVKVYPGQKIVFAGPEKFDIFFKDRKSPNDRIDNPSTNGIVTIEIPRDIFEREERQQKTTIKELVYKYGIRANGKVTDPTIIISRL
jgi:hypothetical protein